MSNYTLKAAGIGIVGMFLGAFGGTVEGQLFPVVERVKVERMEPAENGYTRIWGSFHLTRSGCDFSALSWALIGVSRNVAADLVFEAGTKEREGGLQEFGPWRVQLTPDQIKNRSTATVYHECPYRWWTTETIFYPQSTE